jgi:hypothetical protein
MSFHGTIRFLENNPRKLFLIDGIGATVSAFMLGIVLVRLQFLFGIPTTTLYALATFPVIFILYDGACYVLIRKPLSRYIKVIALMNVLYCLLSIACIIYVHDVITVWGWTYILFEIIILIGLVAIELQVANKIGR